MPRRKATAAKDALDLVSALGIERALALVGPATDHLHVRCSPARKVAYDAAAKRAKVPLTKWVLAVLDAAAGAAGSARLERLE